MLEVSNAFIIGTQRCSYECAAGRRECVAIRVRVEIAETEYKSYRKRELCVCSVRRIICHSIIDHYLAETASHSLISDDLNLQLAALLLHRALRKDS